MLLSEGETMDEFTSNVNEFIGSGSYDRPENLLRLSNSYSRRGACFFALAKTVDIPVQDTACLDEFVGMSEDREDVLILLDNGVALYPDGIIGITDWLAVNTQTKVSLIGQVRPFSIEKPCNTCVIRIKDVTLHGGKEKKRQNQEQ